MIELNSFICGDCMDYLPQFPDKYFELAIVDPPYGIGESGGKNKSRSKIAKAKCYKDYIGNDLKPPDKEYFDELIRVSKNQIIWGRIILLARFRMILLAGLFGTKKMEKMILQTVNLHGQVLKVQLGNFHSGGKG